MEEVLALMELQKRTLLRVRRASLRGTGCHLDADMVEFLAQSILGEPMEIAAGNIQSSEQD
jgi:hypothetical protein